MPNVIFFHDKKIGTVKQNYTNFQSTLKKHPESKDKFYELTAYEIGYGKPDKDMPIDALKSPQLRRDKSAGVLTDSLTKNGLRMSSVLAGEQYRDFPDPQFNTGIQRSWIYGNENS